MNYHKIIAAMHADRMENLTRSQLTKGWNTYLIKIIYVCTNMGHGKNNINSSNNADVGLS